MRGKPGEQKNDIVIIGVGDRGADILYPNARKLAESLLTRFPNWLPRFDLKEGEWEMRGTGYPVRHRLSSMVMSARSKEQSLDPAFVRMRLLEALNREIRNLELDGDISDAHLTGLDVIKSVGVNVKATRFSPAVTLDFYMPFRLMGPWQIGSLKARGYGRLSSLSATREGNHAD